MCVEQIFLQAATFLEAGQPGEARPLFQEILSAQPDHVESLHLLGLIAAQSNAAQEGEALIRRAMTLSPGRAPHHNSLALALRVQGRLAEAIAAYRAAAALRPGSAEIRNNLAAALNETGLHQEAIAEYRQAAILAPGVAAIWCNLAQAQAREGDPEEAEACFLRALSLQPIDPAIRRAYGGWLINRARWNDAAHQLSHIQEPDASIWTNLGVVHYNLGRTSEAEAAYRRALRVDPDYADAHYNLGWLLHGEGRTDDAVAEHRAAIDANPAHGAAQIAFQMTRLPILYQSEAEIIARRQHYLEGLEDLIERAAHPAVRRGLVDAVGSSSSFFLPYQEQNDKAAQARYGTFISGLLGAEEQPFRLAGPPIPGERIRIGIVSGFFRDHTIFRLFLEGWLSEFDRTRFELICFHTGNIHDTETEWVARHCDRFIRDVPDRSAWPGVITDTSPHVLLYPEYGIDPIAASLAPRRLAPLQCVAWGHPVTTGLPTIEYFLTAGMMEPPNADPFYTEHLLRLPGIGTHYTPRARPGGYDRAALGLDEDIPLFWSGQALFKYLPQYDDIFPRIARAVGPCRFIFTAFAKSESVTAAFRQRIDAAFIARGLNPAEFRVILPTLPQDRYVSTAGACDVVLDTPGWSGGKSTLDILTENPAIVTMPGRFMRGRHTAAILRRIGCEETIAHSTDEYVAIAARLARDVNWRARVRSDVAARKHAAFRDTAPIRALENFLMEAVSRVGLEVPLIRSAEIARRHHRPAEFAGTTSRKRPEIPPVTPGT